MICSLCIILHSTNILALRRVVLETTVIILARSSNGTPADDATLATRCIPVASSWAEVAYESVFTMFLRDFRLSGIIRELTAANS